MLLGVMHKWVPMSAKRFVGITVTDSDAFLSVVGGPRESVAFHYVYDGNYVTLDCRLSETGTGTIDVISQRCE